MLLAILIAATRAARKRTGQNIGTRAEAGLLDVVRYTVRPDGEYDIDVIYRGLTISAAIDALEAL